MSGLHFERSLLECGNFVPIILFPKDIGKITNSRVYFTTTAGIKVTELNIPKAANILSGNVSGLF